MRPLNRHALSDIRATARRIDAECEAAAGETARRVREHRQPKQTAVMPAIAPGDFIVVANRAMRVVKVNAKSVVTEGGNRWTAREIEGVATA